MNSPINFNVSMLVEHTVQVTADGFHSLGLMVLFLPSMPFYLPESLGSGGKVVRSARVPMGGWAEEGQGAPRHHDPVPEESSEDEMPPHIHKVNMRCVSVWMSVGSVKGFTCLCELQVNQHCCCSLCLTLGDITNLWE